MEGEITLLIEAARHSARFLLRDYFELEKLQTSINRNFITFSQKAYNQTKMTLHERLAKYFPNIIFDNGLIDSTSVKDKAVVIEVIDGFENFSRAMPFFAIMLTIITTKDGKIIAEKSVINFPALGEMCYAEKGKGVWLEKYAANTPGISRLKMSNTKEIAEAVVAIDKNLIEKAKLFTKLRLFDSPAYSIAQLAAGKIDAAILQNTYSSGFAIELFTNESCGKYIVQNNMMVVSNLALHEKIKHLLS